MSSVELVEIRQRTATDVVDDESPTNDHHLHQMQSALPPADEGYQAWLCLLGCFVANVLIWGFAFSFGILQEYYSSHQPFASKPNGIPAIGTTATGLGYLLMPVYFTIFNRRPRWRQYSTWASLPLIAAALISASFANTVTQLILCQGVFFALAGNAIIIPTISYLDEWFVRRKGLAIGIMWAGDGTGGAIMPLILQALLSRCGFRWTLRIIAGMIVVLTAPLLVFLKPRLPTSSAYTARPTSVAFLKSRLFWGLQIFNVAQALGYFLPTNYLPSYAESIGINTTLGSLTVLVVNVASIFGCVITGALVDRFEVTTIILSVSVGASAAVFTLWGFSTSIAPLLTFCVLYGMTASSYSTCWGGMIKDVQRQYVGTDSTMLLGLLAAGRGIGAVISGPLSQSLLASGNLDHDATITAYGSRFSPIIIFSGATALVGGCSWIIRRTGLM